MARPKGSGKNQKMSENLKKVLDTQEQLKHAVKNLPPQDLEKETITPRGGIPLDPGVIITPASDLTVLQKLEAQEKLELERIAKNPVTVTESLPKAKGVVPNGMVRYWDTSLKRYGTEKEADLKMMEKFNPKRYRRA